MRINRAWLFGALTLFNAVAAVYGQDYVYALIAAFAAFFWGYGLNYEEKQGDTSD